MKLRELLNMLQHTAVEIGSSTPMICGGTPRDKYMGQLGKIADIDITTGDKTVDYLSQEFAIKMKRQYNLNRKTSEDGHSTIYIGNLKLDFSSNFNVQNIDQILNKIGITNPNNMQREIFSRDFTCNSLLMTIDLKKILDPTKRGAEDIKHKIIRTCLSPEITLTSNRNRVIRAVYLSSKLGFDVDKSIIEYVSKNPALVKLSTPKLLTEKLNQSFNYDADRASYFITKMNLWNQIPISEKIYPYYKKHVGSTNVTK